MRGSDKGVVGGKSRIELLAGSLAPSSSWLPRAILSACCRQRFALPCRVVSQAGMEEPAASRARGCVFAVWLHGLGDCGRANEFIADHFSAAALANTRWAFPTAPTSPVTCNRGMLMPSWFDIHDTPITSKSVRGEEDVMRAVQSVHAMIDREIAAGTDPENIFIFGLSQGGALCIASVLLYPKTLGGCAVFSGFLPFSSSFASKVIAEAKKTPVLWVHGAADSLVPIEAGRDGVKFLRGLGMRCEFKVYDGLGHTLAPFELDYCQRWVSKNILKEHGEGLKKGGLSGSWFFGGFFNCFSR